MSSPEPQDWTGRRVALTGGTGFVGWHVAAALRARGAGVVALHRPGSNVGRLAAVGVTPVVAPLTDAAALAAACRGCDVLVHAAGAVDFGDDWDALRAVNVGGTRAVLEAARVGGVRRVVHLSSIVAIGASPEPVVRDETAAWNLGPYRVAYATTKREGEEVALAANRGGLEVVVVNPGCVIGPDDFGGSEFGVLCKRFWRGRVPVHFAGGNNFVDVRDVAAGVLAAAARGRPGGRYLLTGENLRWPAFFRELARAAGRSIPRLTLPAWLAPPLAWVINLRAAKPGKRPALTSGEARFAGLHFSFTHAKATAELGFDPRPVRESLADAHAFWQGGRAG